MRGVIASKDANGELVIKITPAFRNKIIKSLKEKLENVTEDDILERVIAETHHVKPIEAKK